MGKEGLAWYLAYQVMMSESNKLPGEALLA